MPYDLDIPGQVSEFELRAIELVASLVPQDGCIVEVGSLFGRSSWAWAKSVDPSVTVYCVDPWRKNAGIRPMEERFGITYGIEEFRKNTADCDNIEPLQGYSPHDFADWHQPIDLYYDDAVHQDPGFSDNLEFWASHLKPHGILCGDDFRPRFPDICNGVQKYAEKLERELITVDFFWCLLPGDQEDDGAKEVANKLRALASEKIRVETSRSPQIAVHILSDVRAEVGQRSARLPVRLTNLRRTPWPDHDE
ncbi:MAG: class I SAM-dependent methyltransferase, partial [Cyanobacteria bacterium J06638_22]